MTFISTYNTFTWFSTSPPQGQILDPPLVKMSQALRKSPSSEKWHMNILIQCTYDIFLFCMPMKDTHNCIQTSWNALILCMHLSIRPRINHFILINKQCIQMSKGRFSQSQAQMPIHGKPFLLKGMACHVLKMRRHSLTSYWQ